MRFVDLLNEDYPVGHSWVEGHYSQALQGMEKAAPPAVTVGRVEPLTPKGRPTRKIGDQDTIAFHEDRRSST